MFTIKFFQSTPFETLFFQIQALFLAAIIVFLIFYAFQLSIKQMFFDKVVLYYLFLILFMPVYSAIRSHTEFGQPYIYGLLTQRSWVLLGVGVWFYYVLITEKISMKAVEKSFLFLTWGSLIIYSFIALTFDPAQLTGEENYVNIAGDIGAKFKFVTLFITFGTLYYFIRLTVYKEKRDLFILILFIFYIVLVIKVRSYMIFLALTFLVYYFMNLKMHHVVMKLVKGTMLFAVITVVIQATTPGFLDALGTRFGDMFLVLVGEESGDASANARIWESLIVLNYFEANPISIWFGAGKVSNQWNEGYESIFGYFFAADIGILGGVFLYGVLGIVLLVAIPLFYAIKEIRKARNSRSVFIQTIKYMLILSILRIFQMGLYFGADAWIIFFFVLYASNRLNQRSYAE